MKLMIGVAGTLLCGVLIVSGCGSDSTNTESSSQEEGLSGELFNQIGSDRSYYFINEKEMLVIDKTAATEWTASRMWSWKHEYSRKGNQLFIKNKESVDTVTIYNQEVLFTGGNEKDASGETFLKVQGINK